MYYNVGTDLCNGYFCGNTILGALYTPVDTLNDKEIGPWIKDISVVSGKLAGFAIVAVILSFILRKLGKMKPSIWVNVIAFVYIVVVLAVNSLAGELL